MKKNIWIINHYAGNMLFDKGGRHYWFAKYLRREGYNPVVFVANTKHGIQKQWIETELLWEEKLAEEIETPFIFVKSSFYSGNGRERIFNMVRFFCNIKKVAIEYADIYGKPDIILASSVHPLTMLAGIQIAKKFGIKCICEVRDLWPESIIAYGIIKERGVIARLMRMLEKWIYIKSDAIIFLMKGGYNYVIDKGWDKYINKDKIYNINNGIDIESFSYNLKNYRIQDEDLENNNFFKVIYAGSIRKANGIEILINAAQKIKNVKIKILVWGDGDELSRLEEIKTKKMIKNLIFKGKVQKKEIPYILSKGDVLFLDPFEEKISKYGISSNKLFEYLAAGKPILMNHIENYNPASKYQCSIEYDMTAEGIASSIEKIASLNEKEYKSFCKEASMAAEEYSYNSLTKQLVAIFRER